MSSLVERITKIPETVKGKISGVKEAGWEKIESVNDNLDLQARYKFVQAIMKDENVDYDTAIEMCTVGSPRWEPKYSLGWKMAPPHVVVMLAREKGKTSFKKELVPEELELFEDEIQNMNLREAMMDEYNKQKKAKKAAKKAAKQRSFGLEIKSSKKQK